MIDEFGVEMSDAEVGAFLDQRGDGVLAFGGEFGYALPMSFGYDPAANRCVFQFVFGPESEKRAHIEADRDVTLVSYEWDRPLDWRSVVVSGPLRPVEDVETVAASEVFAPRATAIPLSGFGRPVDELEPEWYELDIAEMSGRQAPRDV